MGEELDKLEITERRSRSKELPLSDPANEAEDVFIPLDTTVAGLKDIIELQKGDPTFVRAPVAAGKTTLAMHLATKYKDEFVMADLGESEDDIRSNIINASKAAGIQIVFDNDESKFSVVLKALALSNKTLILDEAHVVFSFPNLVNELFKNARRWLDTPKLKILLFSAVDEYNGEQSKMPPEIRKKYMWYPPMPDAENLAERLAHGGVFLDAVSVVFFLRLCSGHRGIFMSAMEWVQGKQEATNASWDIHDTVSFVKASFERSKTATHSGWETGLRKCIKNSRAVRVNGKFSNFNNIPDEFVQVVFGGAKLRDHFGGNVRMLTIGGFLLPVRETTGDEFVRYDWNDPTVRYGVPNSLMAEYYGDLFLSEPYNFQRKLLVETPSTAADLLARALPFMSFATVVDNPLPIYQKDDAEMSLSKKLKTTLSKDNLPYEDNYNQALAGVLAKLNYRVSTSYDRLIGKTDMVVRFDKCKTCSLECTMASRSQRDHHEHASRFANPVKPNYCEAALKALVIIGLDQKTVLKRVTEVSVNDQKLEVIGLVVSAAHDSYEMFVRPNLSKDEIQGPFFFVCDCVAKRFQPNAEIRADCITAVTELWNPKKRKVSAG